MSVLSGQRRCLLDIGLVEWLSAEKILTFHRFYRGSPDIRETDPGVRATAFSIQSYLSRYSDGGKIADLPFQLEISSAALCRWNRNSDLGEDFVTFQRGSEKRHKKFLYRNISLPIWSGRDDLCIEREHGRRVIVGRVSVG